MKYRYLYVAGILLMGLLCIIGWRARHRVRAFFAESAERQQRQELPILPTESQNHPAAAPIEVSKTDWPWWRGLPLNNHASGPLPPMNWSETENIIWKVPIPGRGHSSPCILGNRIFLTTAMEAERSQQAICLEADSGKILWTKLIHQGEFIHRNQKNSHASSTPATDGQQVFVLFSINNAVWLTSLAMDGQIRWQCEVGPYVSKEGFGASPLLVGDFVIVAADNVNQSWIAAVHRRSGEIIWRRSRGLGTSYASPGLAAVDGEPLILMAGLDRIEALRPADGTPVWNLPGPDMSASTPVTGDGMLFATSCTTESGVFAIRLSDPPQTMWTLRMKVEVPSPLYFDGLVYFAQDIGVLVCCNADDGSEVWKKRLGSNVSASPVLIDRHILVGLEDGRTIVLQAGTEFQQIAENRLDAEGLYATAAISNGRIYQRTIGHLYSIGTVPAPAESTLP